MENEQIIHGTPEQQLEFVIAFHKAQAEFPIIPKNSKAKIETKAGKSYTYNYANLGDIDKVIKPILHKNGFFILQPPSTEAGRLRVKTRIVHIKGGWMEGCIDVNMPSDLKEIGTDITYLRRYSMAGIGIVTDEDVDAPQGKHCVSHKDVGAAQQPAQQAQGEPQEVAEARKALIDIGNVKHLENWWNKHKPDKEKDPALYAAIAGLVKQRKEDILVALKLDGKREDGDSNG